MNADLGIDDAAQLVDRQRKDRRLKLLVHLAAHAVAQVAVVLEARAVAPRARGAGWT